MKPAWTALICLPALLTGVLLGRYLTPPALSGTPSRSADGLGGPLPSPKADAVSEITPQFKQTSGLRSRTALTLSALANGRSGSMAQLVEAAGRDYNQLTFLAGLALHTDPGGFIRALAGKLGNDDRVGTVAHEFAIKWGQTDFSAAFQTFHKLPHPTGSWLGGQVLDTHIAIDPTAALKLAVAHPDVRFNWNNGHTIPATRENIDLVRALPPSMGKFDMIKALSDSLPPDEALAMVFEDRESNPSYALFRVAEGIVKKDPQAAEQWILANPDHPAHSQMARRLGEHLLNTDPAAAVAWATQHLSGFSRTRTLEKAADTLQIVY